MFKTKAYIEIGDNEVEIDIEASVSFGRNAKQYKDGSWDPPEDDAIEDLCIGIIRVENGKKVFYDLAPFLTEKQIKSFEEKIFESACEENSDEYESELE